MSIEAMSWALSVPVGGNAKVILLGLANHAHADGSNAYPSLDTLARYAHCDRSTARRNARRLASEGWIEEDGDGPAGQVKYRLRVDLDPSEGCETPPPSSQTPRVAPAPEGGGTSAPRGVAPAPPEPSFNRPENRPSGESARAEKLRISGRAVNPNVWQRTVAALAEFNRQAGKNLFAVTGTGEPSEAAKRIYSRLAAWPNLGPVEIADVIRRTLLSRWWGSDPPTIGVVFGPKVFEENLSREGAPSSAGRSATVGHATRGAARDFSRFDRSIE